VRLTCLVCIVEPPDRVVRPLHYFGPHSFSNEQRQPGTVGADHQGDDDR
jgi:hypothetical protein